MQDLSAKRTLVKSPPELWDEVSEVERLAKHLGAFGEIKITKLEPEHTVAWEGEHASGTVSIEPSGWGTKVILTAELPAVDDQAELGADQADEPMQADEPPPDAPPAYEEPVEVEPASVVDPPVAPMPPATAPAFDAAAAPAGGNGSRTAEDLPTDRPRRRRGFLARLFAGWLVPEERPNRRTARSFDETLTPVSPHAPSGDVVGESTGDQPPAEYEAVAGVLALDPPREEAEPTAPDDAPPARRAAEEPQPPPEPRAAEAPSAIDPDGARAVLEATLDALGSAHHRPYSRS